MDNLYPGLPKNWVPDPRFADLRPDQTFPELFLGIIRAQGADNEGKTLKYLESQFKNHQFLTVKIEIADLIDRCISDLEGSEPGEWDTPWDRIRGLMDMGDVLRSAVHPFVAAMMAVAEIADKRHNFHAKAKEDNHLGIAYIIRHLVGPDEVARLRSVYKQRFFAIALLEDSSSRYAGLVKKLSRGMPKNEAERRAVELVQIDEGHATTGILGLPESINVVKTMEKADIFLTVGREQTVDRFVEQLFGMPHGAPQASEAGMAYAFLAAKRSVSLGRSVGAAVVSSNGELISLGWNEVANPSTGVCSEPLDAKADDYRDHKRGYDTSDRERVRAIHDFFQAIANTERVPIGIPPGKEVAAEIREEMFDRLEEIGKLVRQLTPKHIRFLYESNSLATTRLLNLIEFGRSVHAEMAAITSAARRGVPTNGQHLFVTTFPCHECARNIVAAGLSTVTYLQPYDKSMASDLYPDLIDFRSQPLSPRDWQQSDAHQKVIFAPFEGIAPHRFDELFSRMNRKQSLLESAWDLADNEGLAVEWDKRSYVLRDSIRGYQESELDWHFEVARRFAEESVIGDLAHRYTEYKMERDGQFERELIDANQS